MFASFFFVSVTILRTLGRPFFNADAALARSPHDASHLRERLGSGEAFDWYYADDAGRAAQTRLPITDGAYGKPWTYRAKDLVGWWSNPHVERIGGVETVATSPYVESASAAIDPASGKAIAAYATVTNPVAVLVSSR